MASPTIYGLLKAGIPDLASMGPSPPPLLGRWHWDGDRSRTRPHLGLSPLLAVSHHPLQRAGPDFFRRPSTGRAQSRLSRAVTAAGSAQSPSPVWWHCGDRASTHPWGTQWPSQRDISLLSEPFHGPSSSPPSLLAVPGGDSSLWGGRPAPSRCPPRGCPHTDVPGVVPTPGRELGPSDPKPPCCVPGVLVVGLSTPSPKRGS